MEFRILGPLEVRSGGGKQCSFGRRKERQLVALLLLNSNRVVTTERIIDWLWDGHPPSSAAPNLQSYLSQVRSGLGDGRSRLETHDGGYLLRAEPAEVDMLLFEDLAAQGRQAASTGEHSLAVERFTRALGLWRAETVAEDLPLPDDVRAEAARLEQLRTAVAEELFEARLALGQHRELVPELTAETRKSPLREGLWVLLMLALYRSGRQAEALEAYQEVRGILAAELGVDPGPDLQRTQEGILAADPALLATPASSASTEQRPAQLPADLMSFTGRGEELSSLLDLAAQEGQTVVISAIDGMAGIGKTALAVHAAHRLANGFPDGQLFIDLHGFTEGLAPLEPAEALDRLLRSLGVPGEQVPHTMDERAALWRTSLAGRRMLVLLDNAATEQQVRPLLPGAASCVVLVTSRRRLAGLDDARPISLDVLPEADAISLFTRVAGPDRLTDEPTELIAEVVELCGRLPLAIRIAAARLRSRSAWTLTHLAERLGDQRHRLAELEVGQRSVAAAIELSYAALDDEQQRMFRLLGLNPGADIEPRAVAALASIEAGEAERTLDELLDVHLLQQRSPGRYRLHDLIRAHAAHRCSHDMPKHQRDKAMSGLLAFYSSAASAARARVFDGIGKPLNDGPPAAQAPVFGDAGEAVDWLDVELDNLLAAAHAVGQDSADHVLSLSASLFHHLFTRARYVESERLHSKALRFARSTQHRRGELDALHRLGTCYLARDRVELAVGCYREALHAARTIGSRDGELDALIGLGSVHRMRGEEDLARNCFEQVLDIAREIDNRTGEVRALAGLGSVYRAQDQYRLAVGFYQEALRVSRECGDRSGELVVLSSLGTLLNLRARHEEAVECFQQALAGARAIGDRNFEFEAQLGLGHASAAAGDPDSALTHHRQALELATELGQRADQARARHGLADAYSALNWPEDARRCWREAIAILTELGLERIEEASVEEIGVRLAEIGQDA